jgi:hypothetical protein
MNLSRRMLWWTGSFLGMCAAICLFLTNWHWYDFYTKARFALLRPELSGFRAPYPSVNIATNGISPDGEWAFILGFSTDERMANPPNCLVKRSAPGQRFDLPSYIETTSNPRQGIDGVVRWAKDSSAVVFFKNMDHPIEEKPVQFRSAYDIYVVPIVHGKPGTPAPLETEILKVSHPDFYKAIQGHMRFGPYFYSNITDEGLDDDFTFNDANQLIIDCYCGNRNDPDDKRSTWKSEESHVRGLWDPVRAAFVQVTCTPRGVATKN